MKTIGKSIGIFSLAIVLLCTSCGKDKSAGHDSGSDSQTTANDSSATPSRAALGTGEGGQKDTLGYPTNQSNLNSDSTSRLHDDDTTSVKPKKDKPNKHE
ncbi:hypothetical protein [Dyadobacter bucti]|uniref:hypothetical protein n=1 Tax=Dyadobacter bucti TaxID=2572203 RepID=UPI003F6F1D2F